MKIYKKGKMSKIASLAVAFSIIAQSFVGVIPVFADDTGFLPPSAVISNTGWQSPNNVFTSDNNRSEADRDSDVVVYGSFNFDIPGGATVNGIEVRVEGYRTAGIIDRQMKIDMSGDAGLNWSSSKTTNLPYALYGIGEGVRSYGSSADLWGKSWEYSEFTNENFRLKFDANLASASSDLRIDYVAAKIFYTPNHTPSIPVLSAPVDGWVTNNTTPRLEWLASSDVENHLLNYGFEISTAGDFSSTVLSGGTAGLVFQVPSDRALTDGVYYWRIRASDGFDVSEWSTPNSFKIDTASPVSYVYGLADYYNTAQINIPFNYSDTSTELSNVELWYRYSYGEWLKYGDFTSSPILFDSASANGDGHYDFYVVAADLAGNIESQGYRSFLGKILYEVEDSATIDTQKPIIGNVKVAIDYDPYVNGNSFAISSKINGEDVSGVKCEYTLDNGENWFNAGYVLGYCSKLGLFAADGQELSINFRATDKAGNVGVGESISRIADAGDPNGEALIEKDIYGPNTYSDNVIKGIAGDNTSGIKGVRLTIKRSSDNKYWNGSNWVSKQWWELLPPTVKADGLSDWSYILDQSNLTDGDEYIITPKIITDNVFNFANGISDSFIWDKSAPIISVTGGDLTVEKGDLYEEQGATWIDDIDGSGEVQSENISGIVDTLIPGLYEVIYTVMDSAGNSSTATRYVTVVDTEAPTITLKGAASVTLTVGATYTELGAETDDGSDVVISGTVDTTTAGVYTINYDSTDAFGNVATRVVRTVNVVLAPVVLGASTVAPTPAPFIASNEPETTDQPTDETSPTPEVLGVQTENDGEVLADKVASVKPDGIWNLFGIAWYWWLIITAIVGAIFWWIIAGYRRDREEQ